MEKLLFMRINLVHVFAVFIFGLVMQLGDAKTMHCYDCQRVHRPHACTNIRRCAPNQMCAMDVHMKHGHEHDHHHHDHYEFSLYCQDGHFCPIPDHSLVGRKRAHPPHQDPHDLDLMCQQCCQDKEKCNMHLCPHYIALAKAAANMTTSVPTTVAPSTPSTAALAAQSTTTTGHLPHITTTASTTMISNNTATVYDPNCKDKEEDGITCAELDLFRMCTSPSSLHYVLAHEKCRRHCGICNADPKAPTLPPATRPPSGVCTNYEQDGFKCANLDLFHICTDTSSLAYVLAHEKCRQHCGFCAHSVVSSAVKSPVSTTAVPAMSQTAATVISTQSSTSGTAGTTALPPVSATPVCRDVEENGFSCSYMDTFNICTTSDAMLNNVARDKCSKHCGFCK